MKLNSLISAASFLSISILPLCLSFSLNSVAEADTLDEFYRQVDQACLTLKKGTLRHVQCRLAAMVVGPKEFSDAGQVSVSASRQTMGRLPKLCREAILDRLKSPGSAKFPKPTRTSEIFEGIYLINGEVDSQNSYGALLRSDFSCVFSNHPKTGLTYLGSTSHTRE